MAKIIPFPGCAEGKRVSEVEFGGALGAIRDYFDRIQPGRAVARTLVSKEEADEALPDGDYFLAWLYDEGFKIVPIDEGV